MEKIVFNGGHAVNKKTKNRPELLASLIDDTQITKYSLQTEELISYLVVDLQ